MYEDQTIEVIRNRILENTNNNLYKGPGSHLWNAASAMAIELSEFYKALDEMPSLALISKSYGKFLDARVYEFDCDRKQGDRARGYVYIKGSNGTFIPNGSIIKSTNGISFRTVDDRVIDDEVGEDGAKVPVEAIENGTKGNLVANTEFEMVDNIDGIDSIANKEDFKKGIDPERDDLLKSRFDFFRKHKTTSGNAFHYDKWATEVDGVVRAVTTECWKGPGTVKVMAVGEKNKPVSEKTLELVKDNIESNRPLCPKVTVVTSTPVTIDISAKIVLEDNADINLIKEEFTEKITSYFDYATKSVKYSKIYGALISCLEVEDITDLTINSAKNNISLSADQVAILKSVEITKGD